MHQRTPAFTLVELVMIGLILAAIAFIALPSYFRSREQARSTEAITNMEAIRQAEFTHELEHGGFVEALDLPEINSALDLELNAQYFDYAVEPDSLDRFVIMATGRQPVPGSSGSLRVTMDQTGKTTYLWPNRNTTGGSGGGGSGGIGGAGGGGGSGSGSGTTGSGNQQQQTGGNTAPSGGIAGTGGNALEPLLTETLGILANDGTLAKELVNFITTNKIQVVFDTFPFTCANGGKGGTIGPSDSWNMPQPGISQIILNRKLVTCGWTTTELAHVLAHEAEHMRQVFSNLFVDNTNRNVLRLEDVEGPAYITETLVWDSLRRDAQGTIVLTSNKSDIDKRANRFIRLDGTVDVAAHNLFITQSRGIVPNCPFFFQSTCSASGTTPD